MGQKSKSSWLKSRSYQRLGLKWYAEADFADLLVEDYKIRTYLKKKLYAAGISKIEIERASDRVKSNRIYSKTGRCNRKRWS